MKIQDAVRFFGYPSQNTELDKYLTSLDIATRPVFNEMPFERIYKPKEGYSLNFEAKHGYEDTWGKPREDGEMIFNEIQVYREDIDSGIARYIGDLPFGLTFETTLAQAKAVFGDPATDHQSGPENWVYVWYDYQGFTLSICFLPEDRGVMFLNITEKELSPPFKSFEDYLKQFE